MGLKNYFEKRGKGWIVSGLLLTIIFVLWNIFSVSLGIGRMVYILFIGLLFIFSPWILGYFGLNIFFWLLIGWEILYFIVGIFSYITTPKGGESLPPYPLLLLLPIVLIIGISSKKNTKTKN